MIKKLLFTLLFLICFMPMAFAGEIFKVTSVNFDTSNSLIFLTSPDSTTEAIMKNVKLTKLQNPKRIYFDINSALLAMKPQNWFLNSGGIKQVKISQFSTSPNKVRVVLYLDEDFNLSKLSFLKVNNNLVIKFKDGMINEPYYQETYSEDKTSSSQFYENLTISSDEIEKLKTAQAPNTEALNQKQSAFDNQTNVVPVAVKTPEVIKKELRLKSKYYLNSLTLKPDGFVLNGFGVVGVKKPMYLTNPARAVFDIPNATVNKDVINKELKFNNDTILVSQFNSNTVRIVITSVDLEKYFPIFSADGQSMFFVKSTPADTTTLFSQINDATYYCEKRLNSQTDEFIITFNKPVVHSVKRDYSKLTMNFYNTLMFNETAFRNAVDNTNLSDMKIDLLPKVGLKLTLPLEKLSVIKSYLSEDGKSVKLVVKSFNIKPKVCDIEKRVCIAKGEGSKANVVLDPGHGGSDYGAIRAGINEKDITLDVAKRVQAILLNKGIKVAMTRTADTTLQLKDRTDFTASINPDIFVSIHVNSSTTEVGSGIETHYYHDDSIELAQSVHSSLMSHIKTKDRGLFKSRFYVINHTSVPAILVEIGFLSNPTERAELVTEDRKQQTAKAIAEGIIKYLNKNGS